MRVREPRKNATRSVAAKRVLTQGEISSNRLPLTDFEAGAVAAKIIAAYLKNNPVNTPLDLNDLSDSILDVLTGRAATNSGVNSSGPGRGKSTFRQRDVRAAIHASETAGKEVSGIAIESDGTIKIDVAKDAAAEPREENEWDAEFK
jgi:hypothetical protein